MSRTLTASSAYAAAIPPIRCRKRRTIEMSQKAASSPKSNDGQERKLQADKAWAHALRRDAMSEHGLRAILLLNSGGAVALLTFLQIAWSKSEMVRLVPWILTAMIPLLIGAASAGAAHFLRYWASMTYQTKGAIEGRKATLAHQAATVTSFLAFLLGMSIVIYGAFPNLP